jgi:hypothetical protein
LPAPAGDTVADSKGVTHLLRFTNPPDGVEADQAVGHGDGAGGLVAEAFVAIPTARPSYHLRIPTQSGHRFRFEVGRRSDLKPATIPK